MCANAPDDPVTPRLPVDGKVRSDFVTPPPCISSLFACRLFLRQHFSHHLKPHQPDLRAFDSSPPRNTDRPSTVVS